MSTLPDRFSLVQLRQLQRIVRGLSRSADFFFGRPDWTIAFHGRTQEKLSRKRVSFHETQGKLPPGTFLLSNYWATLHVITNPSEDPLDMKLSPLDLQPHVDRVSVIVPTDLIFAAFPDPTISLVYPDTLGKMVRVEWTTEIVHGFVIDEATQKRVPLLATMNPYEARTPQGELYLWDFSVLDWRSRNAMLKGGA